MNTKLNAEDLAKIIEDATVHEVQPPIKADRYQFVAYSFNQDSTQADPYRSLFFAHNHKASNEERFLDRAFDLLNLSIQTFQVLLEKRGTDKYPNINEALSRLITAKQEFTYLISLDKPLMDAVPVQDSNEPISLYFSYQIIPEQVDREPQIYAAIKDFFLLVYLPYGWTSPIELEPNKNQVKAEKVNGMFNNYKDIDISKEFGIPKSVSDGLNKVIKHANSTNRQNAEKQYKATRIPSFKTGSSNQTELTFDSAALGIKAAEQFAVQLMRIRDAKILQTFCALWKYANIQNSFQFRDVPISDVMEIVLKKSEKTNFSVDDRRHFSAALQYLAALTITLQIQKERVDKKGKSQMVLQEEKGVKMFRLISEYSLKKAYHSLPKGQLRDEHYDKTVITKFSGELLPEYNRNFTGRSNIYYDALLRMDANKDQKAVVLGFALQTRFNQLQNKNQALQMERGYLIELCDYQKTDQSKASKGTKLLKNVLDKLQENGLTGRYENLTNVNSEIVLIYPPIDSKAQIS